MPDRIRECPHREGGGVGTLLPLLLMVVLACFGFRLLDQHTQQSQPVEDLELVLPGPE